MPANITHPVVAPFQPPDNGIKIWRYIDVIRLVSLMEKGSLTFARSDMLEDRFEGSLPLSYWIPNQIMIDTFLKDEDSMTPEDALRWRREAQQSIAQLAQKGRRWAFINCWHSGDSESAAMWKQYGATGGSVVIQSTYQTLLDALPSEAPIHLNDASREEGSIYMGMVQYKNYFSLRDSWAPVDHSNMLSPFIHKRTAFEYEKEVRAILMFSAAESHSMLSIDVSVEVQRLIESIRVRPETPDWQRQSIESLVRKYGLDKEVMRSEIDREPLLWPPDSP